MQLLKEAVEDAYEQNQQLYKLVDQQGYAPEVTPNEQVLKIFVAPEFCAHPFELYTRGARKNSGRHVSGARVCIQIFAVGTAHTTRVI